MDPSGAFARSSSNVSLASLVRSGSGGSSGSSGSSRGRGGAGGSRRMVRRVLRGVITFIFAIAGLFLGAVTGGLIGLATESGLFRGTGIGAITGALVSIEVVDSSIRLWRSRRSGIWSILYVLNVIYSLLTGRLVPEKVDPAVQRVVWSQMNAVDSSQFREAPDLFEIEGTNGMPRACIDKLPEIRITEEYNQNDVWFFAIHGLLQQHCIGLDDNPYFLFNVDIYNYHPRELLAAYPSATAADGSSALYFVNLVRPKTATDSRKKRGVPGGTWKSERSPLPLVSEAIQGARQTFSFTVLGAKGKEIRQGYIMQELTLAGDEGKLDGGADMAVSKIYPSPRGHKAKRKAKAVPASSRKKRKVHHAANSAPVQQAAAASSSSAPALRLGSSSPAHQVVPSPAPPLRLVASTLSAHLLGHGAASTSSATPLGHGAASTSATPLGHGAASTSATPLGHGAASTSSATPLGHGAASTSSAPPLGYATRLLILEVSGFPPVGEDFFPRKILRASEVVGTRRMPVDCDDVVLLQKKKRIQADKSSLESISGPGVHTDHFTYEQPDARHWASHGTAKRWLLRFSTVMC